MAEPLLDALGPVLARWTMGSAGVPAAPAAWSEALGEAPGEAELRLLALAGPLLALAVVEPKGALRTMPDAPGLALPVLPDRLRPLARRVVRSAASASRRRQVLQFLAVRGWVTHPDDWMPAAGDEDAPDVYAPWRDWAEAAAAGTAPGRAAQGLVDANWDEFGPAARAAAFAALRRRDPAGARALLERRFAGLGAEERLRLAERLALRLTDADADFLDAVAAGDRAPRVRSLAAALLARLGRGAAEDGEAAELAGYFAVAAKGLLRRARVIEFGDTRTQAQKARRTALFGKVGLAAFAAALGLDGGALLDAWPWSEEPLANHALLAMVARSGSDAQADQAAEAAARHGAGAVEGSAALAPRLSTERRRSLATAMLGVDAIRFADAADIMDGEGGLDDPLATPAGGALLGLLTKADAKPADGADPLVALGLLASRKGAAGALDGLARAGMLRTDPRLDMLRLNAALDQREGDE